LITGNSVKIDGNDDKGKWVRGWLEEYLEMTNFCIECDVKP